MLWHYTTGYSLDSIVEDGYIRCATKGVPATELAIVWFSSEEHWEPTVEKIWLPGNSEAPYVLGMQGMLEHDIVLCRIGVEESSAPLHWEDLKILSGMDTSTANRLSRAALEKGADPSRWRGSFQPVSFRAWKAIEFYNGGSWEVFEPAVQKLYTVRQATL